ncbi:MAG: hypothetical protein NT039_00445 [Candidatus Berkelbacteria bacterium]|nr:hypothetical protein [Candidatus Berkelbacteria bacterium]
MDFYKSTKQKIAGTSFKEINKSAKSIFNRVKARTRRTPYLRSKYFRKEKVFLILFWSHLYKKNERDRVRRLRFYDCALDLIINSHRDPETRDNFKKKDELLHRFYGISTKGEKFTVQIKENKRTKRKDLISIYPG